MHKFKLSFPPLPLHTREHMCTITIEKRECTTGKDSASMHERGEYKLYLRVDC